MRAYVPEYELIAPSKLSDALDLLAREPGMWRPIAGGTDLMVLFEAGKLPYRKLISIWRFPELHGITEAADAVTLGALTTYTQVRGNGMLAREFPLLCRAAEETGGVATQNRGTLGGNIVNASPAADSPPALLVYDARIELISNSGSRWVEYAAFHTGYKQTVMRPDELLSRIRLPRQPGTKQHYFRKVGTRRAQAIAKICFAGVARANGVRIALGSVAPTVVRCPITEAVVHSGGSAADARAALAREIAPIDDLRSTAAYRLRVAQNLLEDFLRELS
jgi:CO/xanthine dehydrogenase FAD-binding subunit